MLTRVSGMDLRIHGIRFHSLESSFVKMNVADLDYVGNTQKVSVFLCGSHVKDPDNLN